MAEENMENVLPNKTVAVLIVAALLVTIIGTWTVLERINDIQLRPAQQNGATANIGYGRLSISITEPTIPANSGGDISLVIV